MVNSTKNKGEGYTKNFIYKVSEGERKTTDTQTIRREREQGKSSTTNLMSSEGEVRASKKFSKRSLKTERIFEASGKETRLRTCEDEE